MVFSHFWKNHESNKISVSVFLYKNVCLVFLALEKVFQWIVLMVFGFL